MTYDVNGSYEFLNLGILSVTMQAQKELPADMQCKDKFLLQSVRTHDGATVKDINAEMVISFNFILHVNFEGTGFGA